MMPYIRIKIGSSNNVLREPVLTNHLWNLVALGQFQSAISQGVQKNKYSRYEFEIYYFKVTTASTRVNNCITYATL